MFVGLLAIHLAMVLVSFIFICIFGLVISASLYAQVVIILGALVFYASPLFTYFIRTFFYAGYYLWKNTLFGVNTSSFFDTQTTSHIVSISDVDVFLHMNNGRYRRAMDFARLSFYGNCGLLQENMKYGSYALMVAATGRYGQPLNLFKRYFIKTKILYWDQERFYFEQNFVAPFKDTSDFVYSSNIVALKTMKSSPEAVFSQLLGYKPRRPEPSSEVERFIDYIHINSENLKKTS